MQKYELLLVLPGTFDEKEAETEAGKSLAIVNGLGSNAVINKMGKNRLAYPVKQIRYGYFYTIVFEVETEKIKELKNKLDLDKNILRGFITKYDEKTAAAQKFTYFSSENREESEEVKEVKEEVKAVEEKEEEKIEVKIEEKKEEVKEEKSLDMKDIDKKLDEILADDNLMTKV